MRHEVMNKPADTAAAAHLPAQGAVRQPAYSEDARSYDRRTGAFQGYRRAIVEALPVCQGQVVLDVGCGTGLCCGFLLEKVGPQGGVVGIEESPEMAAMARERVAHEGWRNVTVVQSGAEDAQIAVTADAALFCAVHDILQSPDALRNVMNHLRPGARVAAGGGKWAAPWMVAVNLQARMLHAPYVRSFEGFDRPWHHLAQLIDDVHVRELAFGSGYVLTGRRSRSPLSRSPEVSGRGRVAGRPHQAGVRSVPLQPGSTDQHASSRARANNSGALMQAP
jgi:demethylmenaquinone methyltransferase/2-methoxy-6-polyprenyl-1,4-benzoquinol methylase